MGWIWQTEVQFVNWWRLWGAWTCSEQHLSALLERCNCCDTKISHGGLDEAAQYLNKYDVNMMNEQCSPCQTNGAHLGIKDLGPIALKLDFRALLHVANYIGTMIGEFLAILMLFNTGSGECYFPTFYSCIQHCEKKRLNGREPGDKGCHLQSISCQHCTLIIVYMWQMHDYAFELASRWWK